MLKFVGTSQAMPDKRQAAERRRDFDEIYGDYARAKAAEQAARCSQCGVPSARSIARCTTTSRTG